MADETRLSVLVVDDESDNLELLERILRPAYRVLRARNGREALETARANNVAVILSDQRMPGMPGIDFLQASRSVAPHAARVVVTAYADLDTAVDAINKAGVTGFLRKPVHAAEVLQTVEGATEVFRLRVQAQQMIKALEEHARKLEEQRQLLDLSLDEKTKRLMDLNEKLEHMAVRDGLTGLYNHRYFHERAEQEVQRANRHKFPLSMVFFDIDHFKAFNDANGHRQGDEALRVVAEILTKGSRFSDVIARVRATDVVARYGGEEFVALLPEADKSGAAVMAERLRAAIEVHPFAGEEKMPQGRLTVSAGVAGLPEHATRREDLIECADKALYAAKLGGRNCVKIYTPGS